MRFTSSSRALFLAHILPFALFMLILAGGHGIAGLAKDSSIFLFRDPQYWIYPLQTIVSGTALIIFWRRYTFGSQRILRFAISVGLIVFFIWVSPQLLFGQPHRTEGFDPTLFADNPFLWGSTLLARFLRLVVVVPLLEEIFWRGFLQRYLVREAFFNVPFGFFTPFSFFGVTFLFGLAHYGNQGGSPGPDFIPALLTGAIYGLVAVRTKSLFACIVAHATTNLALGIYILMTKQWGFW